MYDANRMEKYLANTGLMIEEFKLLNTIYVRNKYPENIDLLRESNLYYTRHNFYDRDGNNPIPISWYQMIEKLKRDGFLITYPNYVTHEDGKHNIDFLRIEVTDKFLETIFAKEVDTWWQDFKEIYGTVMRVNGNPVSTLTGDKGETQDEVKAKWLELVGNGDMALLMKMQETTEDYIRIFGTTRKIISYLRNYDALMESLQEALKMERDESAWTDTV